LTDHSLSIHYIVLKKSSYNELLRTDILGFVLLIEACPQLLCHWDETVDIVERVIQSI